MMGGNFNTFGEHAPNLFTQLSDDEDSQQEGRPLRETRESLVNARSQLKLEPGKEAGDNPVLQTPKLAAELLQESISP
jgi:hypothetical protein